MLKTKLLSGGAARDCVACAETLYFLKIGRTLTTVRDLPHSKQHAFRRDVINPQNGHILCVPNPAISGVTFRLL
jgi:hypothetical protein